MKTPTFKTESAFVCRRASRRVSVAIDTSETKGGQSPGEQARRSDAARRVEEKDKSIAGRRRVGVDPTARRTTQEAQGARRGREGLSPLAKRNKYVQRWTGQRARMERRMNTMQSKTIR